MSIFPGHSNPHTQIVQATFSHLSILAPEGKQPPRILDTYEAGLYAVSLWSHAGENGFTVLQRVAGVWAVIGSEPGLCNDITLQNSYQVPGEVADELYLKLTGRYVSDGKQKPIIRRNIFSFEPRA